MSSAEIWLTSTVSNSKSVRRWIGKKLTKKGTSLARSLVDIMNMIDQERTRCAMASVQGGRVIRTDPFCYLGDESDHVGENAEIRLR